MNVKILVVFAILVISNCVSAESTPSPDTAPQPSFPGVNMEDPAIKLAVERYEEIKKQLARSRRDTNE